MNEKKQKTTFLPVITFSFHYSAAFPLFRKQCRIIRYASLQLREIYTYTQTSGVCFHSKEIYLNFSALLFQRLLLNSHFYYPTKYSDHPILKKKEILTILNIDVKT